MNRLWKMWITVWCWGIILFGAVMATAGIPALDGIARLAFNIIGGAQTGVVTLGWDFTILFLLPAIHAAGAGLAGTDGGRADLVSD